MDQFEQALQHRIALLDADHQSALRLFNGFTEGKSELTVDLFGSTLVIYNYADEPFDLDTLVNSLAGFYLTRLPWLNAILLKVRRSDELAQRRGVLLHGKNLDDRVKEYGAWYAVDLQMNQDASFYLDTQNLRKWLIDNSGGKTVLNTFAYTGSLGIAALAGGASSVLQTDLNQRFLEIARRSKTLNPAVPGIHIIKSGDFFRVVGELRRINAQFDTVILDAPFFSQTKAGSVDLVNQSSRLVNKIRPLVSHNGRLIAINNALFLGGSDFHTSLLELCAGGYMEIETLLSVPQSIVGYAHNSSLNWPADPAPFNHPTKIAILRVTRRQV